MSGGRNTAKLLIEIRKLTQLVKELPTTNISNPSIGKCKVTNLYVDPETNKLTVEYDDTPIE